ncbi:MAG: DUF5667 domain-containing protein, partial [Chloroflexota bacterium]
MDMDKELENALNLLKEVPQRDEKTAVNAKAAFLKEAAQLKPFVQQQSVPQKGLGGWRFRLPSWPFNVESNVSRRVAMGLAVFVLLFFASTSGVMYAAGQSLPGDALYPVKRQTESVRLALSVNNDEKLLTSFIEIRLDEMDELASLMRYEDVKTAVNDYNTLKSEYLTVAKESEQAEAAIETWQHEVDLFIEELPEPIESIESGSDGDEPDSEVPTPIDETPEPVESEEPETDDEPIEEPEDGEEPEETAVPPESSEPEADEIIEDEDELPAPDCDALDNGCDEEPVPETVCEVDELLCEFEADFSCDPLEPQCMDLVEELLNELDGESVCDEFDEACEQFIDEWLGEQLDDFVDCDVESADCDDLGASEPDFDCDPSLEDCGFDDE